MLQVLWGKTEKNVEGWWWGHFKNFKHLPNSGGKNQLVTYRLITLKYSEWVFNLYMGLEFGKHVLKYVLCALTKLYVSLSSSNPPVLIHFVY